MFVVSAKRRSASSARPQNGPDPQITTGRSAPRNSWRSSSMATGAAADGATVDGNPGDQLDVTLGSVSNTSVGTST
jgi:hypothetical protein